MMDADSRDAQCILCVLNKMQEAGHVDDHVLMRILCVDKGGGSVFINDKGCTCAS